MLTGLPPYFSENRDEMYRKIIHEGIEFPRYLSPTVRSLISSLLIKDPTQRIGAKHGIQEIKDHPFCMDINWEDVANKKLIPPIKPSQKYSNFDPEYTNLPVRFTFEEDLFDSSNNQRRKSDPGNYLDIFLSQQSQANQNPIIFPNFHHNDQALAS